MELDPNPDVKSRMKFSFKTLAKIGAASSAVLAITGVISVARPYLLSDAPPLANQARVARVEVKINQVAQNVSAVQQHQTQADETLLFLTQGFWSKQLLDAEQALRTNPNNELAREQKLVAQQNLEQIRIRLVRMAR